MIYLKYKDKPDIKLGTQEFERIKHTIDTENLIGIKGVFSLIEHLALGVRDFENEIK